MHVRDKECLRDGKEVECDECNYKCKRKRTLTEHKAVVHRGKMYRCAGCSEIYTVRSSFTKHKSRCQSLHNKEKDN